MSVQAFRGGARPTLGVELELQLVDGLTMALRGAIDPILAGMPAEFQDSVKPEFYESCVEICTGVCHDVAEVECDLDVKLAALARVAHEQGICLAWGGTHPFSHWRDQ